MKTKKEVFGTDGIRGRVGEFPITVDYLLKIGWAVGTIIAKSENKKVLIGKDTRISGYMIESVLEAGLSATGCEIYLLGPMPTPGIAYLTRTLRAAVGIVISASHNPFDDNGVKFFSSLGYKVSPSFMNAFETILHRRIHTNNAKQLGKVRRIDDAVGRYIEFCKSAVPRHTTLKGLKIVIDCANGATYHIAPNVFSELGADVTCINTSPTGFNINADCGSNHPEVIKKHVIEEKADVGIAFDGDGDRAIMVDHRGEVLDGDQILYVIAKGLLQTKELDGGVVGTVMSNLGLEKILNELGIHFLRVNVGDHFVLESLLEKKWQLGGEPSGHIVYLPVTSTPDGIITALQVLLSMIHCQTSLHDLKQGLIKYPQRLINIPDKNHLSLEHPKIIKAVQDAEAKLNHHGRILLRHSGTEPLIRLMIEAENEALIDAVAKNILDTIQQLLAHPVPG